MFYCLICDRKYQTTLSYNNHLTRKQHKTNVMKLESIYSINPDSKSYKQWKKNREMFDTIKEEPKEKKD